MKFKPLRTICSRRRVKKSHQIFSEFQTFVVHLKQLAQEISLNHRYEVHPIGGEIEDLGRKVTKIRQFSRKLVKLKKSEGCRF